MSPKHPAPLSFQDTLKNLPKRPSNAHKHLFGSVLAMGGDRSMPGAIFLSALAALRAGAGLVHVLTHPAHASHLAAQLPEAMWHHTDQAVTTLNSLHRSDHHVLLLGPGLGTRHFGKQLFRRVLGLLKTQTAVIDGDALTLLSEFPDQKTTWILTPHPGEAARLLKTSTEAIQKDRAKAAEEIALRYGGVCVLKGENTLISDGNTCWQCTEGNPVLAIPGSGDVLSGTIAALLAQGLSANIAAQIAVLAHAKAGDLLAQERSAGYLAHELTQKIAELLFQKG